jgi:hypothetical protein
MMKNNSPVTHEFSKAYKAIEFIFKNSLVKACGEKKRGRIFAPAKRLTSS